MSVSRGEGHGNERGETLSQGTKCADCGEILENGICNYCDLFPNDEAIILPVQLDHEYLVGKWATINGTFCYVRAVRDENGSEVVDVYKYGRDYSLIGEAIYSVSA